MSSRRRSVSGVQGTAPERQHPNRPVASASPRIVVASELHAWQLQLERRLTRVLFEADDSVRGLEAAMGVICEELNWRGGTFWRIDPHSRSLLRLADWPSGTAARAPAVAANPRLPSWVEDEPLWIDELTWDDLQSRPESGPWKPVAPGFVLPIRSAAYLCGVCCFEAGAAGRPDSTVIHALRALSPLLGRFCERAWLLERLLANEQREASTLALAAVGIAHVDDAGRFLYCNPRLCQMLGYPEHELLTMNVKQISHPDDANVTDEVRDKLRKGVIESFRLEKRYVRKDGTTIWVALTIAARRDGERQRISDVSIVEDISARKLAEERVQYLATHDGLTGLPNRALFAQLASLAMESARRRDCRMAVLYIDLDRFKTINDSLGHDAGDVLLREMASRFRDCLRGSDVLARLGGDEFVVLLPEVSGRAQAAFVAKMLLAAAVGPVEIHHQECRITASIGICLHPDAEQDDQAVLRHADLAMYAAKEQGRNNYQFYSPAMQTRTAGRLAI
jgi:diguanylate cyclase (GGDEF)-like protein/PAS domain S-box-containing protein